MMDFNRWGEIVFGSYCHATQPFSPRPQHRDYRKSLATLDMIAFVMTTIGLSALLSFSGSQVLVGVHGNGK
jgi:hypothetical protein